MHWPSKKPYLAPFFSLVFAVSVLWVLAIQITDSYQGEMKRANLEIENLSASIEQELLATFREIELAQNLAAAQINSNIFSANPNQNSLNKTSELLQNHLYLLPTIDTIGIIDSTGKLIASANQNPTSTTESNQELIISAANRKDVGRITIVQIDKTKNALLLTQNIKIEEENSAVFFSSISQAAIEKILKQFSNNENTSISIINLDLNAVSTKPKQSVNQNELKYLIRSREKFQTTSSYKNNTAIQSSIRQIANSSLFIIVSKHNSNYLSNWKHTALVYVLGSFLMLGLSLMMIYYFWRSQRLNQTLIQKESKLIASEARFRQMIEAMPIGLILARMPDFLILYINQPAAQTLDMPQATALSKRAFDFYHDTAEFKQQINQLTELKAPQNIECILQKNTKEQFWGSISISMVQGTETQMLLIGIVDISERKQLEAELKHQATTDVLSGLFNRAHFIHSASNEMQRIQRHQRNASLLMLDIDHFKRVNDNYGHDAGDLVIQAIALTCKNILRDIDILGRLGGEEFAALLPETTPAAALQVAERLRSAIECSRIQLKDGQIIRITSSIGVTEVSIHDEIIDIPLKRADLAMYASKKNGRNQVQYYKEAEQ
ncbi:diguanylate cyclase [Deefgea rivuli]|uniref:diguanylate cyclase n=1 Tax=Deefgea rivuli TaxID=400948 RepID=UPI000482CAC9|nr:diguanylate cyclase [Deefgea rivuli]